jgi:hypothetical protein
VLQSDRSTYNSALRPRSSRVRRRAYGLGPRSRFALPMPDSIPTGRPNSQAGRRGARVVPSRHLDPGDRGFAYRRLRGERERLGLIHEQVARIESSGNTTRRASFAAASSIHTRLAPTVVRALRPRPTHLYTREGDLALPTKPVSIGPLLSQNAKYPRPAARTRIEGLSLDVTRRPSHGRRSRRRTNSGPSVRSSQPCGRAARWVVDPDQPLP